MTQLHADKPHREDPDEAAATISPSPVGIGVLGWARWAWRRLTSMRTAVILLTLLALAAVPGSLLPQRGVASDPAAVPQFYAENPDISPWLDRVGLFGVYASPWFAAIYLLLLVSMTGCVLPRCAKLWRDFRSEPTKAPTRLDHLEDHRRDVFVGRRDHGETSTSRVDALELAESALRRRRFRVRVADGAVSAEKGHVREAGNLLFHLSLLVLLFGIAGVRLYGYEARVAVVAGESFTNVASQYDDFSPSVWTDVNALEPFSFRLESFEADFETSGARRGEPRSFDARLRVESGEDSWTAHVRPNQPLEINGTKMFLTGHGYAPVVTVRDGTGATAYSGPVIFLPADNNLTSDGVIKAPDARPAQLGLEGLFLPTAADIGDGAFSAYPDLVNPRLLLTVWTGDLGLDDGLAQSVYTLDKSRLQQVMRPGSDQPFGPQLAPGQTVRLPDDLGTVTFDGVRRFANFQVARDPGKELSLLAALMLLGGLTTSLIVRRRRVYVRVHDDAGTVVVQYAGQSATRRGLPHGEIDSIADDVRRELDRHRQPHRKDAP